MKRIPKSKLMLALRNSWCRETSSMKREWSPDNPAIGQCFPSTLVVNDFLGGQLQCVQVKNLDNPEEEFIHWRNVLPDGSVFDSTVSQFNFRHKVVDKLLFRRDEFELNKNSNVLYRTLKSQVLEKIK